MHHMVIPILMKARVIALFLWKSFKHLKMNLFTQGSIRGVILPLLQAMEEGGTAKCQDTNRCPRVAIGESQLGVFGGFLGLAKHGV